ncbi:MHYT domain-containing protein [Streptomyces nodosus]|uniref:MHYT domain-containing protein n=1 Tax=Streptomyces nodosus TaxID=40318 RepID=UPI0038142CBE
MQGTVDGFSYGMVTPLVACLMACLGGALGLRCVIRARRAAPAWRAGWLALGSATIGSGLWTTHLVAMTGFSVAETSVHYDEPMIFAGLVVAVVMVGIGVFIVGHRGATGVALFTGGTVTGLGMASMHYLGMAGTRLDGVLEYNTVTVAASVAIAVVAATAALWAAGRRSGFLWSVGAGLVMGLAMVGLHYTGMAAVSVHLHATHTVLAGDHSASPLVPMMIGPLVFLCLAGAVVVFDPLMVMGRPEPAPAERKPGVPAHPGSGRPGSARPGRRPPSGAGHRDTRSRAPQRR